MVIEMVYLKRNTIGMDGMEYKFWNRKTRKFCSNCRSLVSNHRLAKLCKIIFVISCHGNVRVLLTGSLINVENSIIGKNLSCFHGRGTRPTGNFALDSC